MQCSLGILEHGPKYYVTITTRRDFRTLSIVEFGKFGPTRDGNEIGEVGSTFEVPSDTKMSSPIGQNYVLKSILLSLEGNFRTYFNP